jgi:hypothetical protein
MLAPPFEPLCQPQEWNIFTTKLRMLSSQPSAITSYTNLTINIFVSRVSFVQKISLCDIGVKGKCL